MLTSISNMLFCSGETKDTSQNLTLVNAKQRTTVEKPITKADESSLKCKVFASKSAIAFPVAQIEADDSIND